jgi:ketosteroid isomerase-like protein
MDVKHFAEEWIAAWNSHDMERILAHYSDDIEITTPMIKLATGGAEDSLKGIEAVRAYWQKALDRIPDLHFELIDVTSGVNSVALYYHSVMNKRSVEVMFFNEEGKVKRMFAHYS